MPEENEPKAGNDSQHIPTSHDHPTTDAFHKERSTRIKRDIDVLRASIALDWYDQSGLPFARQERDDLKQHIKWCALELNALLLAFEEADRTEAED